MASDDPDLIAFLRARLDEDKEMALQAATANPGSAARRWSAEQVDRQSPTDGIWRNCWAIVPKRVKGIVLAEAPADILPRVVKHIEAHDPARVLAEVDAKRRIIDRLEPFAAFDMPAVKAQAASREEWNVVVAARDAIKLLALPYAEHPDYQEFYWQI